LRKRIRFYQQLAVLARAGLPFRASLERLKERMTDRKVEALSRKVNEGERLHEAFAAAGFSPFEFHLIAAGERSAQLDGVFDHLAQFWSRELEMRQAMISPLIYPIVVMHLAIGIGALIQLAVSGVGAAVMNLVGALGMLYVGGFAIFFLVRASWTSPAMRQFWLFVPIVGGAIRSAQAYRWIAALKMEFRAGISFPKAVGDAWRASGYIGCEEKAEEAEEAMRGGASLTQLMGRWKQLPDDWVDFIETGEIAGGLDTALANLETEAARNWILAQQRMAEWLPKIAYFFVLMVAASMVFGAAYKVIVEPITDAESEVDKAINGTLK
jgi:general secretion pathway protein F